MLVATALATAALLLTGRVATVQGGACWSGMSRTGRCTDLLQERVTREECCAMTGAETAWSDKDLDPGKLFFWRVLAGGVPCQACQDTCAGVSCGEGLRCAVRWGRPQCVCAPDCSRKRLNALLPWTASTAAAEGEGRPGGHRGPVCGSDGRSYRSACRLLKRACRRNNSNLVIAYLGTCQDSCDRVDCGLGRSCVRDQNLSPHCVRCERHCPATGRPLSRAGLAGSLSGMGGPRAVCGTDGATYPSACHLREAACRAGKAIPVAYRGRCQRAASCGAVQCQPHQSCLTDMSTGAPRCVTCSLRCPKGAHKGGGKGGKGGKGGGKGSRAARRAAPGASRRRGGRRAADDGSGGARIRELLSMDHTAMGGLGGGLGRLGHRDPATELVQGGPLCGTNNRTYPSWCVMRKDACATGFVIDTKHAGPCGQQHQRHTGKEVVPHLNAVLDENNAFP